MHIHILGICGTFMGGIAQLARAAGHKVTGCDAHVYPPMSEQLQAAGIDLIEGYEIDQLQLNPDLYIIGNAISRGNALLEEILDQGLPYTSGPQWLSENVLQGKHVLAVAGTHGKTTTASMLNWILEYAGLNPSYLIGGVPQNEGRSARLSDSKYFVIEADEYDTAFFDKRSKFVHYRPRTAILNNLEFDHADIFENLAAIEKQFHHLVRTMPRTGCVIANAQSPALDRVLAMGCYSRVVRFDETGFGTISPAVSNLVLGRHNAMNAVAAVAAALDVGVSVQTSLEALARFEGVKRRQEVKGVVHGVTVMDDFAHHPTAIAQTIDAVRTRLPEGARLIAVLEPRSNTMKMGTMKDKLAQSLQKADYTVCYAAPTLSWDAAQALLPLGKACRVEHDLDRTVAGVVEWARAGDIVLVMSNGGFGGIHEKLLKAL